MYGGLAYITFNVDVLLHGREKLVPHKVLVINAHSAICGIPKKANIDISVLAQYRLAILKFTLKTEMNSNLLSFEAATHSHRTAAS